jgi:Dehydrogenases with different specificities (related to short-chain alcohol dehydrogenases)
LNNIEINKVVVITGATSGIGLATARQLAGLGVYVIGIGRLKERCDRAEECIKKEYPNAKLTYIVADLSSLTQVSKLAASIKERLGSEGIKHLDVLINNAGTVSSWYVSTEDGFELQFAVNHLASFKLTYELLPLLERSKEGIIIGVSSGSHYNTRMHWKDVQLRKHYNCLWAYKQSKLANVLFATELNRRLKSVGCNIRAFAVDPGLVNTDIGLKGTGGLVSWFWKRRSRGGTNAEKPANTIVYIASGSIPRENEDVYWKDCAPLKPSSYSQRLDAGMRLWDLSEKMCGIKYKLG